jgi:hypothetical protein
MKTKQLKRHEAVARMCTARFIGSKICRTKLDYDYNEQQAKWDRENEARIEHVQSVIERNKR